MYISIRWLKVQESKEVAITFETIYEILRREKNKEDLQRVDNDFFKDVLGYLKEKQQIYNDSLKKTDLFSISEKENTSLQIQNIKKILKELYDRREKKIIEMALIRSKTKSNIIDTSNMLEEEKALYNSLIDVLNNYRENILNSIIEMKYISKPVFIVEDTKEEISPKSNLSVTKLRFLEQVDAFIGKELEEYGPFKPNDVAYIPNELANIVLNQGRAVKSE